MPPNLLERSRTLSPTRSRAYGTRRARARSELGQPAGPVALPPPNSFRDALLRARSRSQGRRRQAEVQLDAAQDVLRAALEHTDAAGHWALARLEAEVLLTRAALRQIQQERRRLRQAWELGRRTAETLRRYRKLGRLYEDESAWLLRRLQAGPSVGAPEPPVNLTQIQAERQRLRRRLHAGGPDCAQFARYLELGRELLGAPPRSGV